MSDTVNSRVSVVVRVRPLMNREVQGRRCLSISNDSLHIGEKKYNFESIFGEDSNQTDVYNASVRPLVEGCLRGYNATVFAYGQTGSGKTHSIMGVAGVEEEEGIIPRAIRDVFAHLRRDVAGKMASVRVSMLEIYNDDCKDLLHPDISPRDIMIREDRDGRIFFTGAREEVVSDERAAIVFLEQGNLNRSTAETLMNQSSSRSHAVFTISMELLEFSPGAGDGDVGEEGRAGSYVQAKLHLVDLAGSERAKRTGALGTRLKESVGINQGLLSLGKVIRALTSTPIQHVPYRESKLTRFLQDSLGGNSRTVMLACISSAECNLHETLGTLQYAFRAKAVQNRLTANVSVAVVPASCAADMDMESTVVAMLRAQIERMQGEMTQLQVEQGPGQGLGQGRGEYDNYIGAAEAKNEDRVGPLPPASWADRAELEADRHNLTRIMRVMDRIHRTLREHLQHLEEQGSCSPSACGITWNLVSVCSAVVQTLEELRNGSSSSAARRSTAHLRSSLNESISSIHGGAQIVPSHEQELVSLRAELEECREDLKRDEDIFAEKIKELKRCRKKIKALEEENRVISEKHQEVQLQVQKLAGNLLHQQRSKTSMAADSKCDSINETCIDDSRRDLDISVAVAVTEPDISQLMEDLETMAREKEDLLADNVLAEEKVAAVYRSANEQKDVFMRGQAALKERMAELEESMRKKQQVIGELTEEQSKTQKTAESYRVRMSEMERECSALREQLKHLGSARQQTAEEVEEERVRRREYEAKLSQAEEQLRDVERDRVRFFEAEREKILIEEKSNYESKKAADHLLELETFRSEYARLTQQIEQAESKQRKTLEQLTHQISQFKKKSTDSQQQIRLLEDKNSDLRSRLDRVSKMKRKDDDGAKQARNRLDDKVEDEDSKSSQQVAEWIERKVGDIIEYKTSQKEMDRLLHVRGKLKRERDEVLQEIEPLSSKILEAEAKLGSKITEIEGKIRSLKHTSQDMERQLGDGDGDEALRSEWEELQYSIRSYEEHRQEYIERIQRGAGVDEPTLSACQDLREELETLETEVELNAARVAHERLRRSKLEETMGLAPAPASAPGSGVSASGAGSGSAERRLDDDGCFDLLLRDWKTSVLKFNNPRVEGKIGAVVKQLVTMVVQEKNSATGSTQRTKLLQQQLDDKTAEYDELVKAMQKSRSEAMRRQEQQKKEAEEKIAFLLNQLRSLEARRVQDDASRATLDTPERFAVSIANRTNAFTTLSRPNSGTSGKARGVSDRDTPLRTSVSAGGAGGRPPSDSLLSELVRLDSGDLNKEVERRWMAEKERREQLEKRNADMMRELRQLRQEASK